MLLLRARRFTLVLLSLLLASGCGGGGDGGGSVASGVPPSTMLGGMSADNLRKVCDSVDQWGKQAGMEDKLKEFGCRMRGNVIAALAEPANRASDCHALYDPCAQAPAPTASSGAACTPPPASCSATVGELETCLNQMPQVIDELLVILPTCDQVASAAGNPIATALTKIPSSCQALNAKCAGWEKLPGSAPAPR
jgi:hypothetical protein